MIDRDELKVCKRRGHDLRPGRGWGTSASGVGTWFKGGSALSRNARTSRPKTSRTRSECSTVGACCEETEWIS